MSAGQARSGTARTIPTVRGTSSNGSTGDDYTVVASILADKDVDAMLASFVARVAVSSRRRRPRARALPAADLARLARAHFDHVEVVDDPVAAVARAHELGEPVLVTGSLYLLGDLAQEEQRAAWRG